MGWILGLGNGVVFRTGSSMAWSSYWTHQSEVLFFGLYSEISGGQMPNRVDGGATYLTVAGSAGSETYQAPDTAPYQTADTDYIWFKTDVSQRTTTTAELIGYDFTRTIVKYDNTAPYAIEAIMILKSDVDTAKMRDDFDLSVWWSNVLSAHGNVKENRGVGKSVWTPEIVFNPGTLTNILRVYYSDVGVTVTGSGISQITDGSTNAAHATQADDGKRPPLLAGQINGLPVIKGDGTADFLSFTSTGELSAFTLFIVAKALNSNEIIAGRNASGNDYIQLLTTASIRISIAGQLATFATGTGSGTYNIYEIKKSGSGDGPINCYINGAASVSNPINLNPLYVFSIDQLLAYATSLFGKADLATFILYSDYKSDPDSLLVCNWLKAKYAIT